MRDPATPPEPEALPPVPGSRLPEPPLTHQEAAWALMNMEVKLMLIQKTADKARRKHACKGHHCDYRAALDSIADTSKFTLQDSRMAAKFYSDFEIAAVNERDQLLDAVRNLRDVKGRHNTQIAVERLLEMLPENDQAQRPRTRDAGPATEA